MFKKNQQKVIFNRFRKYISVGIVLTVLVSKDNATTKDSFCLSCHDAPEFIEQRAITPHGKIGCLECHGDGFLNDKISVSIFGILLQVHYYPNNYDEYVTEVPNEKCLSLSQYRK
ncbi:hypothetical protein KHA80_10395 [Anaerobacillus sp. HL2]|nr:hypothetical protein KHA80_10395 [Anaerobacillus sp. HL2]